MVKLCILRERSLKNKSAHKLCLFISLEMGPPDLAVRAFHDDLARLDLSRQGAEKWRLMDVIGIQPALGFSLSHENSSEKRLSCFEAKDLVFVIGDTGL